MVIGTILPHTKLYGGVKRFLELGNLFEKKGHSAIIYTPLGIPPSWFDYRGKVKTFESLLNDSIDALFFTEPEYLRLALMANAKRKIFYFINPKENLNLFPQHPAIEIFANSTNLVQLAEKKYGIKAFPAFGGINLESHNPKPYTVHNPHEPFIVMAYGRMARKVKGTQYVIKACQMLVRKGYKIELLLFDTPVTDKMQKKNSQLKLNIPFKFIQNHPVEKNQELYHRAHVFVAAEGKAGWSNTAAEAMACGIPVVGTKAGTTNFLFNNETGIVVPQHSKRIAKAIEKLINDEAFRKKIAENGRKKIEEFDWVKLANKILQNFESSQLRIEEPTTSPFKSEKPLRLGLFATSLERDYNKARASFWIRILQMVKHYQQLGADVSINQYLKRYDVSILFRKIKPKYYYTLLWLKLISKKVYFDTVINMFDLHEETTLEKLALSQKIARKADGLICSSHRIAEHSIPYAKSIHVFEDPVDITHFNRVKTDINFISPIFGWSGVGAKSVFLNRYANHISGRIILISEPQIEKVTLNFQFEYVRWNYEAFPDELLRCDVALLPRDYNDPYNDSHSSFKALVFAVLGIPIIASKVPSYVKLTSYYDGIVFLEDFNDSIDDCLAELRTRDLNPNRVRAHYSCEHQGKLLLDYFNLQLQY